jgi:hypothetical protein
LEKDFRLLRRHRGRLGLRRRCRFAH